MSLVVDMMGLHRILLVWSNLSGKHRSPSQGMCTKIILRRTSSHPFFSPGGKQLSNLDEKTLVDIQKDLIKLKDFVTRCVQAKT